MRVVLDLRSVHAGMTGIGRYAANLCLSLDAVAGVEVEAITTPPGAEYLRGDTSALLHIFSKEDSFREEISIPELLRCRLADVYHNPLFMLPAISACRSVCTVHDVIPLVRPDLTHQSFKGFFGARFTRALKRPAHIVTVSEHSRDDLLRCVDIDPGKVSTVHEPVSPRFRPSEEGDSLRILKSFGLVAGYLLYVGALDHRKNLARLLDAYARVRLATPSCPPLVVVGATSGDGFDLGTHIQRRGLEESVHPLGRVSDDDLVRLYGSASVFVFPSLYEGFGLPVVEAMASGTPVLTSTVSSLPEVAGDAAHLANPESVEDIEDGIALLLRSAERRDELAGRGIERAATFTLKKQGENLTRLYQRILREAA